MFYFSFEFAEGVSTPAGDEFAAVSAESLVGATSF